MLLPALQPHEGTITRAGLGGGGALPREALAGRVAVVDDEVSVARFMHELLSLWGLTITTFADGRLALDALAAGAAYDLVITDQTMPGMTGLELAREARALHPDLPVVLYSGYGDGIAPSEIEDAGVAPSCAAQIKQAELLKVASSSSAELGQTEQPRKATR